MHFELNLWISMNRRQGILSILSLIAKIVLACCLLPFQFYFLSSKYWNIILTWTSYRRKPQNTNNKKTPMCLMPGKKKINPTNVNFHYVWASLGSLKPWLSFLANKLWASNMKDVKIVTLFSVTLFWNSTRISTFYIYIFFIFTYGLI